MSLIPATTYALFMGVNLFLWPVVIGFTGIQRRLIWIGMALCAQLVSAAMVARASRNMPRFSLHRDKFLWLLSVGFAAVLAGVLFHMPITFFGDEAGVAIPALTLLQRIANRTTWTGLLFLSVCAATCFLWIGSTRRQMPAMLLFFVMMGFAMLTAWMIPRASTLAVRYPPLVHIVQSVGTIFTFGHIDALRMPNVLWTLLLALSIGQLTPEWTTWQRILAFLIPSLTPLGWTYRTLLYQACGEVTLGMCATLLLSRILAEEQKDHLAAITGMLFSLWVLYRPTSIAVLVASTLLLLLFKKRRSAFVIAAIAGPIALLWIGVYFLGSYQYDFLQAPALPSVHAIAQKLVHAAGTVPVQLHTVGLGVLLAGSMLVLCGKNPLMRSALLAAWAIGIANTAAQQAILPDIWVGFSRYNILLVLPLTLAVVGLASESVIPRAWQRGIVSGVCLLALLAVTPFNFISFAQNIRTLPPDEIRRSVTGGDIPTPMPRIVRAFLEETKDIILIQPEAAYLDLFVARGIITLEDRTRILERSRAWTAESFEHPVLIQAPAEGTTYQPNLTAEEEQKLREAEIWARKQQGVQEVHLGNVVTLIIP